MKLRIAGEIKCPGFAGGTIYVKSKDDFCALKEAMDEALIKNGCTITFSAEPDAPKPKQGSMFEIKPPKGGQQSLFGGRRRK